MEKESKFGQIEILGINDDEFRRIALLTKRHFGINLLPEQKDFVAAKLQHTLYEKNIGSVADYADYLEKSGDVNALNEFAVRITTNHTYFYREKEHFNFLLEHAITDFYGNNKDSSARPFSIWCAGCSSGEEAYTLAMLIREYEELKKIQLNVKITATDLSEKMISQARIGGYGDFQLGYLPVLLKYKYFDKISAGQWRIKDMLRKNVNFEIFNLMSPSYSFGTVFDAIFCRNVMIYFDTDSRNSVIRKMAGAQPAGGYLFISHSEMLPQDHPFYRYIAPAVYKKDALIQPERDKNEKSITYRG